MDFADEAVQSIWKLIAVILHLGNIEFEVKEDNGESIANISNTKGIANIANLLQVKPEELKQALLTRVIAASGEVSRYMFYFNQFCWDSIPLGFTMVLLEYRTSKIKQRKADAKAKSKMPKLRNICPGVKTIVSTKF